MPGTVEDGHAGQAAGHELLCRPADFFQNHIEGRIARNQLEHIHLTRQ
jgi:hypothetical protein